MGGMQQRFQRPEVVAQASIVAPKLGRPKNREAKANAFGTAFGSVVMAEGGGLNIYGEPLQECVSPTTGSKACVYDDTKHEVCTSTLQKGIAVENPAALDYFCEDMWQVGGSLTNEN